ncbi:MAG: DHHA1 domain-containing protein [Thermoplasmata archaeon]
MREYLNLAKKISEIILSSKEIIVVSHIDADGISAAGIASSSLERAGIEHKVLFTKQLDSNMLSKIKDMNPDLVWFTDLGSGQVHEILDMRAVITDHHFPSNLNPNIPLEKRKNILEFLDSMSKREIYQLNPHLFGKDGALDISGAGVTYIVSRELKYFNYDLSKYAIVGAVGDLQDNAYLKLIGTNRYILKEGEEYGFIRSTIDIRLFGRETRPLPKFLSYSNDPVIPGITNDERGVLKLLDELGIPIYDNNGKERTWVDLSIEEKRKILSHIVIRLLTMGFDSVYVTRLIGEVYLFPDEKKYSHLSDAKEFATLLNSCGRYNRPELGLKIIKGDREDAVRESVEMLKNHKKIIIDSINYVREIGIIKEKNYQYFDAGSKIPDTVLGTIVNMTLSINLADQNLPIFGFVDDGNGMIKVSARASRSLIEKGLDLSKILSEAARIVGGYGGGHNIAAGGSIPKGTQLEFLKAVERLILKGE